MNDIEIHPECNLREDISPATHLQIMEKAAERFKKYIVKKEISAIITTGAPYSKTLLEMLPEMNVRIPEDVSLAGVHCDIKAPANGVTSIVYDWPGLIKTSVEALKNMIDKKQSHCGNFLVHPDFYEGTTVRAYNYENQSQLHGDRKK